MKILRNGGNISLCIAKISNKIQILYFANSHSLDDTLRINYEIRTRQNIYTQRLRNFLLTRDAAN